MSRPPLLRAGYRHDQITPAEVVSNKAPTYPAVVEERLAAAWHHTDRYANNHIESDHGRLKSRLRPMRGLKEDRSGKVIITGHGVRAEPPTRPLRTCGRGASEPAADVAFDVLALAI